MIGMSIKCFFKMIQSYNSSDEFDWSTVDVKLVMTGDRLCKNSNCQWSITLTSLKSILDKQKKIQDSMCQKVLKKYKFLIIKMKNKGSNLKHSHILRKHSTHE